MLQQILFILLLLLPFTGKAQAPCIDEKCYVQYGVKEGLSNNNVTSITQDRYGYLWIATVKGLNRFDGQTFQHFYADSSQQSLPQDLVSKLKWLDDENLAAATGAGLYIINIRTLKSRSIIVPKGIYKHTYKTNVVMDISGDARGNIFLLTRSGFYQYNALDKLVFRYDYYKQGQEDTIAFAFGRNMARKGKEEILIASSTGFFLYHTTKRSIQPFNAKNDQSLFQVLQETAAERFLHSDSFSISMIHKTLPQLVRYNMSTKTKTAIALPYLPSQKFDWRSALFILNDSLAAITGKLKGFYLLRLNAASKKYEYTDSLYFSNYFCSSVFTDNNGQLWIGTTKGIFREKRQPGSLETLIVPEVLNPFKRDLSIRMITVANEKIFAASGSEGLLVFDRASMQPVKKINFIPGWPLSNLMTNVIKLDEQTVLAGTMDGLFQLNTNDLKLHNISLPGWVKNKDWVASIFKDSRHNIYLCRGASNEYYFRKAGSQTFKQIDERNNPKFNILTPRYITEDRLGNIWFSGHGISRLNYQTMQFDKIMDSFPQYKMARREALGLVFDNDNNMYFGLPDNGLIRYDASTQKMNQLTRDDGLPDNFIIAIYKHKNKLWLGTTSGLASYEIQTKKIEAFGISDDMPTDGYTASSFYFDSANNQLYGAFNNTIIRFNPDKLTKNSQPPQFFIESINVSDNQRYYHPGETIEFSYRQNNLVLNLGAINFEDAFQQQFAYRFVQTGKEVWQTTGFQRSIIFSNLQPGTHRLQVKTYINNNSWPEQIRTITIIIHPPFWQTTWFMLLAGVLILSMLYVVYRFRIKHIRQQANIDRQLAELEMKGLHAQMNPHFIFNSLNSIKEMILHDEKHNASRYLSKFAQLIRTSLDQSQQAFITVKQSIEHLRQYLEMEKLRFDDFEYCIELDEALDAEEIKMAPMLIQPLVENAIWHGLRNITSTKKLTIRFLKQGGQLVCEIEDNGIGIQKSLASKTAFSGSHRSVAISNIRERLYVMNEKYNMHCSLEINDLSDAKKPAVQGTIAILKLTI